MSWLDFGRQRPRPSELKTSLSGNAALQRLSHDDFHRLFSITVPAVSVSASYSLDALSAGVVTVSKFSLAISIDSFFWGGGTRFWIWFHFKMLKFTRG